MVVLQEYTQGVIFLSTLKWGLRGRECAGKQLHSPPKISGPIPIIDWAGALTSYKIPPEIFHKV